MKVSITTHLPDLGIYFIEEVAKKNILEFVIIQRSKPKLSLKNAVLDFLPKAFKKNYYRNIFGGFDLVDLETRYKQIESLSARYGFKLYFTENINTDLNCSRLLNLMQSEYLLVLGGRIIKQNILDAFRGCWINGHGGVLPQYRGLCSEYWAVKNKDSNRIGTTIHRLTKKVDFGSILKIRCIQYSFYHLIFMLEAFNHANLILNYINVVNDIITNNLKEIEFDSDQARYYSVPRYYTLKQYLPVVLLGK